MWLFTPLPANVLVQMSSWQGALDVLRLNYHLHRSCNFINALYYYYLLCYAAACTLQKIPHDISLYIYVIISKSFVKL